MVTGDAVFADLTAFRAELKGASVPYQPLLRLTVWRPVRDAAIDWALIVFAVATVVVLGWWMAPLSILLISNRQRSLSNILHDAGHRNVHRNRFVNDTFAQVFLAPLVFADLSAYRDAHFRHHLQLGDPNGDPDYLRPVRTGSASWVRSYLSQALSFERWWGSLVGHLASSSVSRAGRLYIVFWWTVLCSSVALCSMEVLLTFVALWFVARVTAYHFITMFREMCDHYGLAQGGVLSFTRDIVSCSIWYGLVHPRNNGYHLTHHLLPAIPYYYLPSAQYMFSEMPTYRTHGRVCDSYVFGASPVVHDWTAESRDEA